MKRRSLLLALCSSAFISAPALADEVKQEAEKLAVAYTDCVAKKDAACVAALYTKDGVQINRAVCFPISRPYTKTTSRTAPII
ncbi:hypothetical protein [Bradyrhizobium sp. 87]|uniref:hypothetical protein n=1 Tax=Bradyrhizobium sp. 87 TaxID=2782682 RepID=UPI001FFB9A26|nr:hypothetical protein [Bradyrhizobium sp. 87]